MTLAAYHRDFAKTDSFWANFMDLIVIKEMAVSSSQGSISYSAIPPAPSVTEKRPKAI